MTTTRFTFYAAPVLAAMLALLAPSCTQTTSSAPAQAVPGAEMPVRVARGGEEITFAPSSPQLEQITTAVAAERVIHAETSAPAHLTVSSVRSEVGGANLLLFETQDLTQAYAEFVKSRSALERSRKELDRTRDLASHNAVPEKELLDAEHEFTAARAELAEKEGHLRQSGIDPGSLSSLPPGTVCLLADIPEGQLRGIAPGAPARVTLNSFPDTTFRARLVAIGDVIDPATRTVKVRLMLPDHARILKPGMFGTVAIDRADIRALVIPRSSVVNAQGKAFVFRKVDPTTFERREVRLMQETPDGYAVQTGVAPGDQLVTGGSILLKGISFGY